MIGAGDVEKMIGVGLVWGLTNSLMRRGALIWDRSAAARSAGCGGRHRLLKWVDLLLVWQYSVPFLVNLSASAAFFYLLSAAPISVAVPVTNAVTFAATAASAALLGEEMRLGPAMFGKSCI